MNKPPPDTARPSENKAKRRLAQHRFQTAFFAAQLTAELEKLRSTLITLAEKELL
ncbi:MAG: hypothetical protein Q4D82_04755 [Neisseria sp.]|nr:hypothetical protein [Neisseria sp.]